MIPAYVQGRNSTPVAKLWLLLYYRKKAARDGDQLPRLEYNPAFQTGFFLFGGGAFS